MVSNFRDTVSGASEEEKTAMLVERDQKILSLQTQLDNTKQEHNNIEEKMQ